MTISAVGSLTPVEALGQVTFTVTTTTVGNVIVVGCRSNTGSYQIDSMSGGGCTWIKGVEVFSVGRGRRYEIWVGTVTSVVSGATVTVTWSGDVSAKTQAYNPQEFTNGSPSTWTIDGTGGVDTSSTSSSFSWPSIAGAASGELYFGQGSATTGNMTGGTPAGFTFKTTTAFWMYGVTTTATVSPVSNNSASANYGGAGLLLKAVALTPAITTTLIIAPTLSVNGVVTTFGAPGSVFDLENWKLTVPTDGGDSGTNADEILQPDLDYYRDPSYFTLDGNNRMVCTAPAVGATTSGSGGTRSELREMDGSNESAWSMSSAKRRLTVSGYYDPTGITGGSNPRDEMIVGQIHATGGTPPIYITVDYDASPTRMRVFKDGPGVGNLVTGFTTADRLAFAIEILAGKVNLYGVKGTEDQLPLAPQFSYTAASFAESTNCYLKAGAYNKTDVSSGSTGASVAKIAYLNLNQNYTPSQPGTVSLIATPTLTVSPRVAEVASILLTATPTLTANGIRVTSPVIPLTIIPTLSGSPAFVFKPTISLIITPLLTPTLTLKANQLNLIITPTATFNGKITFLSVSVNLTILPTAQFSGVKVRPVVQFTRYPYPPPSHPFRLIAQEVLSGAIVDWDLPVQSDFSYTTQLSGPTVMSGSFKPEIISVQELGLDGYAYFFHAEIENQIRATAIFLPPKYEDYSLSFSCEGIAAVPHYVTWGASLSEVGIDPLVVVRNIWNHVQSNPLSNLGVVVSNNLSGKLLGTPAHTDIIANADGTTTTNDVAEEPYQLQWWDAVNCGEEIDNLSTQTPFDYRERVAWNTTSTDVNLFIDLGYPRLGAPRPNLLFNNENIIEVVPVQEGTDTFASEVIVIGAGEGSDTVRGYAAAAFGKRIRKVLVVTDKTITSTDRADKIAKSELDLRKGNLLDIDEIVVRAKHPNASIGEYDVGDDIFVQVDVPWLLNVYGSWYRIVSINYAPFTDIVRLTIKRSDSFRYPTT